MIICCLCVSALDSSGGYDIKENKIHKKIKIIIIILDL